MTEAGDRILVLVGITANRRKRRAVRDRLGALTGLPVEVPWLPYPCGISACAAWLRWRWAALTGMAGRVHVLAYIGGAVVLGAAAPRLDLGRLGRLVFDRGPVQERVAGEVIRRTPRLLRWVPGVRVLADLARIFPQPTLPRLSKKDETGLIVERGISGMAQRLGLTRDSVPAAEWLAETLGEGAGETLFLDLSHDEVYEDEGFLRPAAQFLTTGHFAAPQGRTRDG